MKHDYSDEEIVNAYAQVMAAKPALEPIHLRLRAFLHALPRRESQALAEATPPAEPAADATTIAKCAINNTEQNVQFRATAGYGTWGAADPEPAAQVPLVALDQDDFKPGTWIEYPDRTRGEVSYTRKDGVKVGTFIGELSYSGLCEKGCRINTSIPDTGRWDANAWRPCSKPGKEVAK